MLGRRISLVAIFFFPSHPIANLSSDSASPSFQTPPHLAHSYCSSVMSVSHVAHYNNLLTGPLPLLSTMADCTSTNTASLKAFPSWEVPHGPSVWTSQSEGLALCYLAPLSDPISHQIPIATAVYPCLQLKWPDQRPPFLVSSLIPNHSSFLSGYLQNENLSSCAWFLLVLCHKTVCRTSSSCLLSLCPTKFQLKFHLLQEASPDYYISWWCFP